MENELTDNQYALALCPVGCEKQLFLNTPCSWKIRAVFFPSFPGKVTAVTTYKLHFSKVCGQSNLNPPTFFTPNLERHRDGERDKSANWKNEDTFLLK